MAYQSYYPSQKKKKSVGGSSVLGTGGGGGSGAGAPAKTPGSGFVNLDQYLGANRGQTEGMADTVIGSSESDLEKYQEDAENIAEEAKEDYTDAAKQGDVRDIEQNLYENPQEAVRDANKYQEGYEGQDASEYYQPLESQRDQLAENFQNLDNPYMQQAKMQNAYNQQGNYSSGFGALDSFLVGADDQSGQRIQDVKGRGQEVTGTYDQTQQNINDAYEQGQSVYNTGNERINKAASDAYKQYKTENIGQAREQMQAQNQKLDEHEAALQWFLDNVLMQQAPPPQQTDMQPRGPNPERAMQLAAGGESYDPSKYYDQYAQHQDGLIESTGRYGMGDFLTDDQIADIQALASLAAPDAEHEYNRTGQTHKVQYNDDLMREIYQNAGDSQWSNYAYSPESNSFKQARYTDNGMTDEGWTDRQLNPDQMAELNKYLQAQGY